MTAKDKTMAGFAGALILLAAGTIAAQGPGMGFPGRGPGGPGRGFGGGPPVAGAPFSATQVRTFAETLPNGNAINHASCATIYRDSAGDTREEVTPNSPTCSNPQFIVITNVAAGLRYNINVAKSTYFQMKLPTPPTSGTPPAGPPPGHHRDNVDQMVKTPLGTSSQYGGVSSEGTQTTITIPAGKIGNAQAITITSVRWYASALHLLVYATSNDPRGGNETVQVNNVVTSEPSAALFELPSGLTQETGHPGGMWRHGPPPPPPGQ